MSAEKLYRCIGEQVMDPWEELEARARRRDAVVKPKMLGGEQATDELRERRMRKYGKDFAAICDGIRDGGAIMDMYESHMFTYAIDETRM